MKHFFAVWGIVSALFLAGCDKQPSNNQFMQDLKLSKVTDYFYEVYYDDYDYVFAEDQLQFRPVGYDG